MPARKYKIRKAFLIPMVVNIIFIFVLFVNSFTGERHPVERIVLAIILIIIGCIVTETMSREITIDDVGIRIKKFLRQKALKWEQITNIDAVILQKKVYLALTTTRGFFIISNSYENFTDLVRCTVEPLGDQKVEKRVRELVARPIRKLSDIVGAWIAAILLLIITYIRVFVS